MDEFASCRNGFVLTTFNTVLRNMLQNSAALLTTTAFALTSSCQSWYPLFTMKCSVSYKRRRKYIGLSREFQLVLIY